MYKISNLNVLQHSSVSKKYLYMLPILCLKLINYLLIIILLFSCAFLFIYYYVGNKKYLLIYSS